MHTYSFPESDSADEIISDREQPSQPSPMKSHKLPGICHVFNILTWTRQGKLKFDGDLLLSSTKLSVANVTAPPAEQTDDTEEEKKIDKEGTRKTEMFLVGHTP